MNTSTLSHSRILFPALLALAALAARAEEKPAPANLRLQLPPGETLRYAWALEIIGNSKGQELGKPLDLRLEKSIRMTVVLKGEAPPKGESGLAAVLRFEDLALRESRVFGQALRSVLTVDKEGLVYTENNRVLIDSRNDVGLDKLTEYQRRLRALHQTGARLAFDSTGRLTRLEGDRLLLDTAHGGHAQGLFPVLAGLNSTPGISWESSFQIPALLDVQLETPASVRSRATFAKWDQREGRPVALLDVLAGWESRDLRGQDAQGLRVAITKLEGQGGGAYLFDAEKGRFVEGAMSFRLTYHITGERGDESTALDVTGRGRFNFHLLPPEAAKVETPGKAPTEAPQKP